MTTLTKQPPRKTPAKKKVPKRYACPAPGKSRRKERALYWFRHPLNAAWGWFSSVRTAILLIVAVSVVSLLGIYFQQAPGEVVGDPTAYATWVQMNELPRFGSLTPIFNWLQFFTIFSSWYFILLLILLATSILIGGMLNRLPALYANVASECVAWSKRSRLETGAVRRRSSRRLPISMPTKIPGLPLPLLSFMPL